MTKQEMDLVSVFTSAVHEADIAGEEAADKCEEHMIQVAGKSYPICGNAQVDFRPATNRFVRFLKKEGIVHKNHHAGGAYLYVSKFGQSYNKKLAYALAFADSIQRKVVLSGLEPTLNVYGSGRLD